MSNVSLFNSQVSTWTKGTKRKMKLETLKMVVSRGPGVKNQRTAVRQYMGEASRIQFSFPYYMVFVHKGAGRGYGGGKSGLFTNKKGGKSLTNKASMGKMGTGKRKAKPWFNPILEDRFPELADIISEYHGGKAMAKIEKILIR